jgi:hypothetical protein
MAPVAVCVTATSTPGNTAPLWSFTVPLICAVETACAKTLEVRAESNNPVSAIKARRPVIRGIPYVILFSGAIEGNDCVKLIAA